ncbi:primosomal protein DnaI [uncultured Gemella sp.]|uniref:primosomal protein DnaI n=1 Tax=uncultured Gemella sp. TaxID=254352 RepID=UPI0028D5F7B3|nr:primosomal protein DnaI [uncultured Gemella sp.]
MKKISNIVANNTIGSYKKFMSEKVLSDVEIIKFIRDNNFTKDDVENNLEKFYQFYISKDTLLNIEHRPKLVYENKEVNIVYIETEEYRNKVESLKISNRVKTEFIPSRVLTYTFENLSRNREKGILATEIIKVCKNILSKQTTRGVYVYGPTGTGKTYLMGCIYNYFKQNGKEPAILYYPEFIRKIKSKISNNSYDFYIDLIRNEEILIIDDIGAENITEFIRDEVLGPIINHREAEKLPTFFSSNLSIDDLSELLSNGRTTIDKTKALRIVERIHSLSISHFLDGENEREYYN